MAATKKFSESIGNTLASVVHVSTVVDAATAALTNTIDLNDYLNGYPKIGLDAGYTETPINSDFKYSLGTPASASFSFIDKDAKQVIYYSSKTPTGIVSVYRAYRHNIASNLIFDNDPISLTFLNPNERLHSFVNVGTNYILARLIGTTAPLTFTRYVLIKTYASSLWADWTFAYDVSSLMGTGMNLHLVQSNGNDYILRTAGMTGPVLTVYDSSLTLLRTQVLINNATDVDLVDRTGQGRTGIGGLVGAYNAQGLAPPFTWNPHTQTLHQRHASYVVLKTAAGNNVGVSYSFSISWNIPLSWITSGIGVPTNLIPIKSDTYRYRVYSDSTWNTDAGGVAASDSGTCTSIITDEFSGELHLMGRATWGTTNAGNGQILKYVENSPQRTFSSLLTDRQLATFNMPIPDGSPYAKSMTVSGAMLIGDYVLFIGNSNEYGQRLIWTKYSSDMFATVIRPNDTLILNSASSNIDPLANAPAIVKAQGISLRINTTVIAGVPTYSFIAPGQTIYIASVVDSELSWTDKGVLYPAIPTTIDGKTGFVSYGAYAWNGSTDNPVFYALVKTATYFYMAKCSGGVWSIPGDVIAKAAVDAGNASRGDLKYGGHVTAKNNLITESGVFLCEVTVSTIGDTTTHLVNYNTNNDTSVTVSPGIFNTHLPPTGLYDYAGPSPQYEGMGCYGYSAKFGYFAFRSPLELSSTRILSSKDIRGVGAPITESAWYSNTGNSRYEIVISSTSSVGLIAYISEYPVFLGGYYTKIPRRAVALAPNSDNYIYAYKTSTNRTDVEILVSPERTSNSFSKVCIAKITTNADKIIGSYVYSFDGTGLPDQEGKAGQVLRTNGKTAYWAVFDEGALLDRINALELRIQTLEGG